MPRKFLTLALLLGGTGAATGVCAQSMHGAAQPRIAQAEAAAPVGSFLIGGYSSSSPGGTVVVDFYGYPDRESTRDRIHYATIVVAQRSLETADGRVPQGWADVRTCGPLYGVMVEFGRLAAPAFVTPTMQAAPPPGASALGGPAVQVHPRASSVWGRARQADGALLSMTISGTDGLIDRWTGFAEEQLQSCWTEARPEPDRAEAG